MVREVRVKVRDEEIDAREEPAVGTETVSARRPTTSEEPSAKKLPVWG